MEAGQVLLFGSLQYMPPQYSPDALSAAIGGDEKRCNFTGLTVCIWSQRGNPCDLAVIINPQAASPNPLRGDRPFFNALRHEIIIISKRGL